MKIKLFIIAISFCFISNNFTLYAEGGSNYYDDLFNEICNLVKTNFYSHSIIQEKFHPVEIDYRNKIKTILKHDDFSTMINDMLSRLDTSHTYYLSPDDYEYYHLASVFYFLPEIQKIFHNQEIKYPSVGIITETIGKKVFIASVLSGSIAEKSGLLAGDEIITVNKEKYQAINSIKKYAGKQVKFTIRREYNGDTQTVNLIPKLVNPKIEMLEAERSSVRLIETQKKKIGYIHIYSYAGEEYHDELTLQIINGLLKDIDALIIDLRYGLGGADPVYLNIFNRNIPVITSIDNTGKTYRYDPQFRKPAVFLVNKFTRSGKEILAFGAKKYKLATVIGEQTAGAVTAGKLIPLSNGDLIYLASRSSLIDGINLEGVGVIPDISIPMDIRYCKGKDIQLNGAIEHLLKVIK